MFIFLFITISYTKVTDLIIEKSQKLKKKKKTVLREFLRP
jgi:hypothetical protein